MSRKSLVPIVLPADPVAALEAAPKQYVDLRVLDTGDTMIGALLIHLTGAALRVRQTGGTVEGLVMDTSTGLQLRNALPLRLYRDNGAAIPTFRVDANNGALYGAGTAPTIVPLAALGVGGTATVTWGNDAYILVALVAGTSGMSAAVVATVTLPNARPNTSYNVNVQPTSAVSTDNGKTYCSNLTTTSFQVNLRWTPTSGQTFNYLLEVIGMGA